MSIAFTDRELKRAWRQLKKISMPHTDGKRENAHRLLLFYAVECGLKAVWLKRKCQRLFTAEDVKQTGHDLGNILTRLSAGHHLKLPGNIQLTAVIASDGHEEQRNCNMESLHQVWRYGGVSLNPTDQQCEVQLEQVLNWINGELQ
ncbi:hypothetical protein [Marinospirillum alkaliphilum]|uniref:HEPN domain-containing protein n=1 Tax=Marinospirillum alkaliphilum DSM 21637 TaxID=1122209 RepID=A0A1K1VWY9_9GAMM|nr:hypothetical protein [Marinospirillum alkaliphilum]SFX29616.1 hypothetical protein SAMN02745752_01123 [Marinospirillum alkaliphilum DSM 21637]